MTGELELDYLPGQFQLNPFYDTYTVLKFPQKSNLKAQFINFGVSTPNSSYLSSQQKLA